MPPVAIIMIGIQGSGKTTARKGIVEGDPSFYVVSPDEIRFSMLSRDITGRDFDKEIEGAVWAATYSMIRGLCRAQKNFIVDATNTTEQRRNEIIYRIRKYGRDYLIKGYWLRIPLEIALQRNALRERKLDEKIIRDFYQNFEEPRIEEGFDIIMEARK